MNLDRHLLRQASQSRLAFFLTILLGFAAGVLTALQAGLLSRVVNVVFLGNEKSQGVALNQVPGLLAILLAVMVFRAGLVWGSEISAGAIAQRVKSSLREQLFRHLQDRGPIAARQESTGELTSVLVEAIDALDAYYSQYLPQLVLAALVPVTFLLVIFPIDWISGLVLLLTAPLIPLFMILIGNLAQELTQRQWATLSRMNAYFLDVIQGLTTLKIFGRSKAQADVIRQVSERYRQTTMSVLRVTFLSALVLELVSTLSTAIVAVEVGLRLLYGRLSFEQAFFVLLLAPEFYLPLRLLGTRFHAGMSGVAAAHRIFQVLAPDDSNTPAEANRVEGSNPASKNLEPASIRFDQVSFSYGGERHALKEVSFEIQAGQKVALVGPSGAGKSTVANLLLRFIEPVQGTIRVGEMSLQDIELTAWREHIAWVSQNPYLFQDTILANIRLANPDASLDEVTRSARWAHADEFICALPNGYNTLLGEHGMGLSSGQAQRIALARAFVSQAPLVILDEATASLDPETQALIQDSVDRLLADSRLEHSGITALVIAHRLSTVVNADQIIVLDAGQMVEKGTHAELMMKGGLYQKLVTTYRSEWDRAASNVSDVLPVGGDLPASRMRGVMPATALDYSPPTGLSNRQSDSLKVFYRLLKLVWPFRTSVGLSVLAGVATIASGVGLMATSAYLISAAALQPSIADLQVAIVGVRFFGLARGLFRYLERYMSHQATFRVLGKLRVTFYKALEPLAPARLAQYRSGDLLARVSGDIESLQNFYVRALAPPLVAAVAVPGTVIFIGLMAGALQGLALLLFMLSAGFGLPLVIHWVSRRPGRSLIRLRGVLSAALVDGIQGMAELAVFNQSAVYLQRVMRIDQELSQQQGRLAVISGFQSGMMSLLANLGMWSVLVLTIPQVLNGELPGIYLAVVTLAALTGFEAVASLPAAAQVMESNLHAARRLFELTDARPEVIDPAKPLALPDGPATKPDLRIRGLSFVYPQRRNLPDEPFSLDFEPGILPGQLDQSDDRPPAVLADITFDLPFGKRLAIVGPSGSGKSTLIALLLRFWEYRDGSMKLCGDELYGFHTDDLRGLMAVVADNTTLFNATVRDNITLGRPKASQAELDQAVEQAQASTFIDDLPDGYAAWIGEAGARLSAGQRQRLGIARAILKNAPILILDEPTASLDALTEREVLIALDQYMDGRSVLMVTHRLVGLERMDEILVLRQGRIIERGTHAELLAAGGYYRKMYDLQQSAFEVG